LVEYSKLLREQVVEKSEEACETIEIVGICLQRLVFTTNNILVLQMIRQKNMKINSQEINIQERIMGIFKYFS